jgi:hypothetical protein
MRHATFWHLRKKRLLDKAPIEPRAMGFGSLGRPDLMDHYFGGQILRHVFNKF